MGLSRIRLLLLLPSLLSTYALSAHHLQLILQGRLLTCPQEAFALKNGSTLCLSFDILGTMVIICSMPVSFTTQFHEGMDHVCLVHKCLAHLQSSCQIRQSLFLSSWSIWESKHGTSSHVAPNEDMSWGTQEEMLKMVIDTCLRERTLLLLVLITFAFKSFTNKYSVPSSEF